MHSVNQNNERMDDGNKYPEIFEANRKVIQGPAKIFFGQVIRIPKP